MVERGVSSDSGVALVKRTVAKFERLISFPNLRGKTLYV